LSTQHLLTIEPALMKAFLAYAWPGNLRQLNNVLKTAAIMAGHGHEITRDHLADDFAEELCALIDAKPLAHEVTAPPSVPDNLEQIEITTIRRVLDACGGNVSTAARQLNISRNTIYRKLKKQA